MTGKVQRFSYLIGVSILQKIGIFILNMLVLRTVRVKVAGAASIQMEFFLSCILFPREALRLAFLRSKPFDESDKEGLKRFMNTAWLNIPLSIFLAVGVVFVQRSSSSYRGDGIPYYDFTFYLYVVSAIIESLSEPFFLLAYTNLDFGLRVKAESWAFTLRGFTVCVALIYFDLGLLAYGISQITYSIAMLFVYCLSYWIQIEAADLKQKGKNVRLSSFQDLLPRRCKTGSNFDPILHNLGFPLIIQAAVKFGLTEGDKFLLSTFESTYSMGVYAVAFNLGSLVPRILFQPIEETSRALFSKLRVEGITNAKDELLKKQESYKICSSLIKLMLMIGLVFALFGSPYTLFLIRILLGEGKSETEIPVILAWYCIYIAFIALNGIVEAFVYAMGSASQLMELNGFLSLWFACYAVTSVFLVQGLQLGWWGLILGNMMNMLGRILYCLKFMSEFFEGILKWKEFFPSVYICLWLFFSHIVLQISHSCVLHRKIFSFDTESFGNISLKSNFIHLCGGISCLTGLLFIGYVYELSFLKALLKLRTNHKSE